MVGILDFRLSHPGLNPGWGHIYAVLVGKTISTNNANWSINMYPQNIRETWQNTAEGGREGN